MNTILPGVAQKIAGQQCARHACRQMQNDLVDSYRLLVYPVILGTGKRMFAEGVSATLRLVSAQTLSGGVMALVYEPERSA